MKTKYKMLYWNWTAWWIIIWILKTKPL